MVNGRVGSNVLARNLAYCAADRVAASTIGAALGVLLIVNVTGCERSPSATTPIPTPDASMLAAKWNTPNRAWTPTELTTLDTGERLYQRNCAGCHLRDGRGQSALRAPALRANPLVLDDSIPFLRTVLFGRNVMPAFRNALNDTELAALASYLRNAWGNDSGNIVEPETVARLRQSGDS